MESRSAWTDERLDDRFDHIDAELAQLRVEMRQGFSEMRAELRGGIGGLRGELRSEIGGLRGEINDLRTVMIRSNLAMMVALIGVIAAILVRGA